MSLKINNPEEFRKNIRTKITAVLAESAILDKIVEKHNIPIENVAINLEKGVFNYAIREASFRKLVKKWENPAFF